MSFWVITKYRSFFRKTNKAHPFAMDLNYQDCMGLLIIESGFSDNMDLFLRMVGNMQEIYVFCPLPVRFLLELFSCFCKKCQNDHYVCWLITNKKDKSYFILTGIHHLNLACKYLLRLRGQSFKHPTIISLMCQFSVYLFFCFRFSEQEPIVKSISLPLPEFKSLWTQQITSPAKQFVKYGTMYIMKK